MLRFKNISLFVFFFADCFSRLTSCQALPKSDPQVVASPDRVTLRLAGAADRATKAMETLAEVEQVKNYTDRGNVLMIFRLN